MNASTRTASRVYVLTANVEDMTPGLFGHTLVFILLACPILIISHMSYQPSGVWIILMHEKIDQDRLCFISVTAERNSFIPFPVYALNDHGQFFCIALFNDDVCPIAEKRIVTVREMPQQMQAVRMAVHADDQLDLIHLFMAWFSHRSRTARYVFSKSKLSCMGQSLPDF